MSNRANSLGRFLLFGIMMAVGIIMFLGVMGISGLVLPVLIGAIVGVAILVAICWGGTMLLNEIFQGNNPTYQRWKKEGDPWFDTLPPPFRAPAAKHNAPYSCLKCQGPMQTINEVCSTCNFGANEMVCACGLEVVQPVPSAFETVGVICPNCNAVLYRGPQRSRSQSQQPQHQPDNTLPADSSNY